METKLKAPRFLVPSLGQCVQGLNREKLFQFLRNFKAELNLVSFLLIKGPHKIIYGHKMAQIKSICTPYVSAPRDSHFNVTEEQEIKKRHLKKHFSFFLCFAMTMHNFQTDKFGG